MMQTARHRLLRASSFWTGAALFALALAGCGSKDSGGTTGSAGASDSSGGGGTTDAVGASGSGGAGTTGTAGASGSSGGTTGTAGASGSGGAGTTGTATGAGGSAPATDGGASDVAEVHPTGAPVFVAVGDNGATMRSLDLGKTWVDSKRLMTGEIYGFRASAYGKGLFVAIGWQLYTSPDGKTWTMRKKDADQWMEGVALGNDMFVAAGGYGQSTYSMDGITWPAGGLRMTDPARSVAFGNGVWVARADSGHWWQTADGKTWTDIGGGHGTDDVVFCGDKFSDSKACTLPVGHDAGRVAFGEGVWVGSDDGKVDRSEDGGKTWTIVTTPATDRINSISFAYVAP
jgi:hypothetical protein